MPSDHQRTNVIAFPQRGRIDVEAAFRRYQRAGLVNARFGIEGVEPLFWGYHDPRKRWNGWAVPGFIHEVAGLIAEWLNGIEGDSAWWEGSTLCVRDGDRTGIDRIDPDELGLHRFDGWVWLESTAADHT